MTKRSPLRILHLYPKELGINGDVGNVHALKFRAEQRGFDVEIVACRRGQELPDRVDAVHIGSGPLTAQLHVLEDLRSHSSQLHRYIESGTPVLAVGGGWQLLGREIIADDGRRWEGLGIFPSTAVLGAKWMVGEIAIRSRIGVLTGFENHADTVTLHDDAVPLGDVLAGIGNREHGPHSGVEGIVSGTCIGTHLHGAILPMNPTLADHVLALAVQASGGATELDAFPLQPMDDYAQRSREVLCRRIGVSVS